MLKFSANLTFLYQDIPFLDRFEQASRDGFDAVEYLGPYEHTPEAVAEALGKSAVSQALFNLPPGNWNGGERGIASLPGRQMEFREGLTLALRYANALNCPMLNAMSGLVPPGADVSERESVLVDNLRYAAERCADAGIRLLLEPINQFDMPGFLISTTDHAERILERTGSDNLFIQYDFYHMQIMQGDIVRTFHRLRDRIAHVQVGDNPGRGEPGTGEIAYDFVLGEIQRSGYDGWVGAEYKPTAGTTAGLGWMKPYLKHDGKDER